MAHLTLEFVEVSAEVLAATEVINAFSVDLLPNKDGKLVMVSLVKSCDANAPC